MKKIFFAILFFPVLCFAQTNISGIINTYTPVLALNTCNNKITVADATTFKAGDTVLLIQMKGATIDSTNTSNYGTIINYNNSGNYEFNYVKSKLGNIIELKNVLTRQYDIPFGKVQLIRVPYYNNVNVTSTLTCLPWDGTIGGVLILNVQDTVTQNANIDVDRKGFRGAVGFDNNLPTISNCFENNYNYPLGSILSGHKGESITDISDNLIGGKGSPASAGGAGLDHNSGGGGGGNGGIGGYGGYQWGDCLNAPFDNRGIGGKQLNYSNTVNKIFMGGGGGSGHANNPGTVPSGGNGGGIIIINAQRIKNNNSYKIIANGENAASCTPNLPSISCHDGMGGGGGGGTVLLNVNQLLSNTIVEQKGGRGADMTGSVAIGGKIGAGGGGGGGVLWLSSASILPNLTSINTGGIHGVLTSDGNSTWGAVDGNQGVNIFNLKVPIDLIAFKPNIDSVRIKDSLITCSTYDFKGLDYINTNPINNWQWYFGDGQIWNTKNVTHTYTQPGTYTVKLVVTDINGCKDSIQKDVIASTLSVDAGIDIDVCKNKPFTLSATAIGATSFLWTPAFFLNNNTLQNPTGLITATTKFYVTVTNTSGCTLTDSITAKIDTSSFSISPPKSGCSNTQIQLNASGGNIYLWTPMNLVDNPSISNPYAKILSTQLFTVKIVNSACNDSVTLTTLVTVNTPPIIVATKSNDITCSLSTAKLSATGGAQYVWSPSASLNNSTISTPVASPINTTKYFVQGIDINGCSNYDSVTVVVNFIGNANYFMPNVFSPNGDGLNDCFGIKNWGVIQQFDFLIFNRYGEKVFHTTDANKCWDGKYKTNKPEPGNYVYYIKAKTACGNVEKKGNVILIR